MDELFCDLNKVHIDDLGESYLPIVGSHDLIGQFLTNQFSFFISWFLTILSINGVDKCEHRGILDNFPSRVNSEEKIFTSLDEIRTIPSVNQEVWELERILRTVIFSRPPDSFIPKGMQHLTQGIV